ncbi:MAG: TrpB-like pyridoxal phosphate-dependent enzyme [Acidobacteria bacterium]|nr:TrpB-like pyridoxal phosphate-dependent enzyme [Acidobacteriota bacterium]
MKQSRNHKAGDLPLHWYNLQADLQTPLPPMLHPVRGNPVESRELTKVFPLALVHQEFSTERFLEIPPAVREVLGSWRPTPLVRASRLEKLLETPARIFYKYEGSSPTGSHKPNTAVVQAYYARKQGITRLVTETGAGQWGSALAMACSFFNLQCKVYMVKVSHDQKPYRRMLMQVWGADVISSPSRLTGSGRKILRQDPACPGSLGIAMSEALEDAAASRSARYSVGSGLNHVIMHQTVIGLEAKHQLDRADLQADVVIGCVGGGSNFAGLSFPFACDRLLGSKKPRILAVEPAACPSLTRGTYQYDFADTAGLMPRVKMYTLGHTFVPPPLHAGGLRYHGVAPLVSKVLDEGIIEATAVSQRETFKAAVQFARAEGILPAPESAHAVCAATKEALRCKKERRTQNILFCLSGHGYFDLAAYEAFLEGKLADCDRRK